MLFSCKDRNREKIYSIVQHWEDREVLFPHNNIFSIQGRDTVNYSIGESFKILVYVDSIGCTSCRLKLQDWKNFMSEVDSLSPSPQVQFLFFITPKSKPEISYILSFNDFTHPVCIDEQDSINLINHFPSDVLFQTFLLDKNNKVVAMGNPIYNLKVRDLYMSLISGKSVSPSFNERASTTISLLENNIDFGSFSWYKEQEREIRVMSNTGSIPLVVDNVSTSCGCISVEYSKEPVQPSKKMVLKVKYKAEHAGHFNKTVTVYCNAENAPFKLRITGNAE